MTDAPLAAEAAATEEPFPGRSVAPAPEQEPTTTAQQPEAEQQAEPQQEEPEELEFDFGGNKLRIKKDAPAAEIAAEIEARAKEAWRAVTQRNQAIAEEAKALAAQKQQVETLGALRRDTLDAYAEGVALRKELDALNAVDLLALSQRDQIEAQRVMIQRAEVERRFNAAVAKVSQLEQEQVRLQSEASQQEQHKVAAALEEGRRYVARAIPGWGEAAEREVVEYATARMGVTQEQARNWALSPQITEAVWKAAQWDKLQKAAKQQSGQPKPAPVQPVTGLKGQAASPRSLDDLNDDEYLRERMKQRAASRR